MSAETQIVENPLMAVGILTTIPVVMFALWADYFGRYIAELETEEPDYDRSMQLGRVRLAGLYVWLVEVVIFLAATDLRSALPAWANLFFAGAIVTQSYLQWALERRIRGSTVTLREQLRASSRFFMWVSTAVCVYLATAFGTAIGISAAAEAAGVEGNALLAMKIAAQIAGIFTALIATFALSPFYLRRLLPSKPLQDEETHAVLRESFAKAGIRTPEAWVIDLGRVKWSNVLVAGFGRGRWLFRPGIFFSGQVLNELTRSELRAVLLHEASHFALRHLRRRLLMGFAALLLSFVCAGLLSVAAFMLMDSRSAQIIRVVGFIGALFAPFIAVKRQIRTHELEADHHAVVRLGAGLEPFATALRKLDGLNDIPAGTRPADTVLNPASGHPTTEVRILLLRKALQEAAPDPAGHQVGIDEDSTDQAA